MKWKTMLFFEKDINNIMITLGVFVAAIFRMIPSFNKVISAMQNMKFMASAIEVIYNEFNHTKLAYPPRLRH